VTATEQTSTPELAPSNAPKLSGPFGYGDRVQLTGPKGRLNTVTLIPGGEFHSHRGMIKHDDLIGVPDGSVVENSSGEEYLALRPLLSDFVMSMPRGAAIVYPKDAAQILSLADIFPGARVVEAGVGSGALSLHLLRAVGDCGELFSFERREEFAEIATANAAAFSGAVPANWTVTVGDLQDALPSHCEAGSVDRVVLDMLAPWECVDVVAEALKLFYEIRDVPGMKKKPSTSELLDWLKLLMVEDVSPETLRERDNKKLIPPLAGALIKNEQDVHLFERLAFMARRDGR